MPKNNFEQSINEMIKDANGEQPKNKYNLKPTSEIRPYRAGSMSQEIKSTYDNLSDLYGVDLEDLVYGKEGFKKTKYPNDFPDFKGDVVYSEKYWDEFEDFAKSKGIDFDDRRWERYKLDPNYFERSFSPDIVKKTREYGKKLEPEHEIHKRELPDFVW